MPTPAPQFTPTGGEGSTYGDFTFTAGAWAPNQQPTPTPLPSGDAIITTGTNPSNQFNQDSQQLNNLLTQANTPPAPTVNPGVQEQEEINGMLKDYSDPYTQMLDKIGANSDKATKNLIATIKATKASREQNINVEYDRLKQGLMSLGLSTDKMQYTPDLVYGSITQAENERMGKLQTLDQQESTALLEAQQARDEKDFSILKDKMAYIKDIHKSRLEILKDSFDTMSYESKIGEIQAKQIYDELQKLPEAQKVPFLQQLSTKLGIPLVALTSQVQEITRDRTKKAAGSGGGYTSQELRRLRQAGIDSSDIAAADDFLYGKSGKDPFESLKPERKGETLSLNKRRTGKLEEAGITSEDLVALQKKLAEGYSLKQIANASDMPDDIYQMLSGYVKK